jgi:hypothetical protein
VVGGILQRAELGTILGNVEELRASKREGSFGAFPEAAWLKFAGAEWPLPGKRVHQRPTARPHRQPTTGRVPRSDQPRDRLVITPGQRRRASQRARQVNASRISIASSGFFTLAVLGSGVDNKTRPSTGASGQNRGENRGHPWGEALATNGELSMATVTPDCAQRDRGARPWLARDARIWCADENRVAEAFQGYEPSNDR